MFSRKAVFVVALLVLALAASRANAISCARAIVALGPCRDYLVNKSNMLTSLCCQAANSLNNMVKSKEDIRNLCECFKKAVVALKVNVGRAKAIPNDMAKSALATYVPPQLTRRIQNLRFMEVTKDMRVNNCTDQYSG